MNKGELIAKIASQSNVTKVLAEKALNTVLANMTGAMEKGDRVTLSGFGSFRVVSRAEKKGRNPQTGQSMVIPTHNVVKFRAGKNLLQRVKDDCF